jgi:hypothetical protein
VVADPVPAPAPEGEAFDGPLPPGATAVEVCSLDAIVGVEADGPAIGAIARRGDGTLVVVMDEQLALLAPVAGRDCRFTVTTEPRPGLVGAGAELVADRESARSVWIHAGGALLRHTDRTEAERPIDERPIVADPRGGVWATTGGRLGWIRGDGEPTAIGGAPRDVQPLALTGGGLVANVSGQLVRLPISEDELGPPAPLSGEATLVRTSGDALLLAAPRASDAVRVVGPDGTPRAELSPGPSVDLVFGLVEPVDAPCVLTGLTDAVDGTAYVALETVREGVRLLVVARLRGL